LHCLARAAHGDTIARIGDSSREHLAAWPWWSCLACDAYGASVAIDVVPLASISWCLASTHDCCEREIVEAVLASRVRRWLRGDRPSTITVHAEADGRLVADDRVVWLEAARVAGVRAVRVVRVGRATCPRCGAVPLLGESTISHAGRCSACRWHMSPGAIGIVPLSPHRDWGAERRAQVARRRVRAREIGDGEARRKARSSCAPATNLELEWGIGPTTGRELA
jgi:hypothetical protein